MPPIFNLLKQISSTYFSKIHTIYTLYSPRKNTDSLLRDRGSKFYGFLIGTGKAEVFLKKLDQIKKKYPDATHYCYAYRVNPNELEEFSNDDGEPSGTAGLPILNQLRSYQIINAGVVVVRYYGGTKLGKSGLIQAYGGTADECLKSADLIKIRRVVLFRINYPYRLETLITKMKNDFNLTEQDASYTESVSQVITCPSEVSTDFANYLLKQSYLGLTYEQLESTYIQQ